MPVLQSCQAAFYRATHRWAFHISSPRVGLGPKGPAGAMVALGAAEGDFVLVDLDEQVARDRFLA